MATPNPITRRGVLKGIPPALSVTAISGARSAVFPVPRMTVAISPCDMPRFQIGEGDLLLFVMQDAWDCDGLYLTHDGELAMISLSPISGHRRVIWPDGTHEDLTCRDAGNMIAARMKRQGAEVAHNFWADLVDIEWKAVA